MAAKNKLRLGHGRREDWGRQKLTAVQYWRPGGVADQLVYVFVRCCCSPPWGVAAGDFLDHILELPSSATSATS
jgi:hypothetical protein